ncbi:tRNA isopentenyltransferase [Rozella allomycis CSF55]|uniref:tRNA dimethylallyltransferase n=1 Tax=Rozella allomycis (strain CSF55) TaxID=988480 RepID=A0A4V1IZZ2_ROZAC|nr:tRNA isopentenyltransferase [Rozella allomycis CSF55]
MSKILFICGPTASGKSDLAVQLALKYNGEIINADAMQCLKGLSIITNKISADEMKNVPHHMFNEIAWNSEFNVKIYTDRVVSIIQEILEQNKLPIVVGGTNYYIQSLLFDNYTADDETNESFNFEYDNDDLYEMLKNKCPEEADRYHPNDERKIKSALKRLSKKKNSKDETVIRYPNAMVVIIKRDLEILDSKIDKRAVFMIQNGAVEEVERFLDSNKIDKNDIDFTDSIFQSIGFREIVSYLNKIYNLEELIQKIQVNTKRYARKQQSWFRNKLIPECQDKDILVDEFSLDDLSKLYESVETWFNGGVPTLQMQKILKTEVKRYHCPKCPERIIIGLSEWNAHIKSSYHRKRKHDPNKSV